MMMHSSDGWFVRQWKEKKSWKKLNHPRRWAVAFFAFAATFILLNETAELTRYEKEKEKKEKRKKPVFLGNNVLVWKERKWMEKKNTINEFDFKVLLFILLSVHENWNILTFLS